MTEPDTPGEVPAEPVEPAGEAGPGPHLSEYAHPELEVQPEIRRYPSTLGGVFFLMVLAVTLAGVGIAALGRWALGLTWIGGAMLAAAGLRMVLPERQAGMLHVRRRLVDVTILVLLGAGLLVVAASIL